MKLCDLHTHVLPGVDDGAPTMEYALQMLRNACASDVQLLAVTPHYDPIQATELTESFVRLQQAASDIPIQLVLGAEVYISQALRDGQLPQALPTLNGSRYLLTEFSPELDASAFQPLLRQLLDRGYVPLVAHPERYTAVCRMPQITEQWLDMGCHLQLTGGSITGEFGKTVQRAAQILLQQDLVACVASDAHGTVRRSNFLLDVHDCLSVYYSKAYADCLMYENPMRICRDELL